MTFKAQSILGDTPVSPLTSEVFSDGQNKILSIQLSREDFLANEDSRMKSFIDLYQEHCPDGQPPMSNEIPPEKIAQTGMMSRTHCLRIDLPTKTFRFAIWAQDANFDGFQCLQNATFEDLSQYSVMADALKSQLAAILDSGQLAFFEIKGVLNDRFYYFTKAILPLRDEQGKIVKCFVPFTNKLPDIPSDLREEFCLADIDEE
jgi:hypothetical protein